MTGAGVADLPHVSLMISAVDSPTVTHFTCHSISALGAAYPTLTALLSLSCHHVLDQTHQCDRKHHPMPQSNKFCFR